MRRAGILAIALFATSVGVAQTSPAKPPKTSHAKHKAVATAPTTPPALQPFVGTWKLVSSMQTNPDGKVVPYGFGPHPAGYLMYDATGHMCAQVVNTDRPRWKDPDHPTAEEVKTAFDGFGGYCGTYTVDSATGTAAHHPEVPFDPNLVGQSKSRNYRFEDEHLIYSGTEKAEDVDGEIRWEMVWERVR